MTTLTIKLHVFSHHGAFRLVLFIHRDDHHAPLPSASISQLPTANLANEAFELGPMQREPAFQDLALDLAAALADVDGDLEADQLLEAVDVGDQVGVEVVAVQRGPEAFVIGLREERVEGGEFLDGFGEGGVAGGG